MFPSSYIEIEKGVVRQVSQEMQQGPGSTASAAPLLGLLLFGVAGLCSDCCGWCDLLNT